MKSSSDSRFALRQRLPFTREGLFWLLISAAMLVTGLIKGINLINLIACWVIVLILWNWWLARRQLRRLGVDRRVPEFVFAQTPFPWQVTVSNAGRKPAHSVVVTEVAAPHAWFVSCVGAQSAVDLQGTATLPCRGAYTWSRLRLTCGHPVGLASVVREFERPQELLVAPRLGLLHRAVLRRWLSQHCPTQGMVRGAARRQPTAQMEFHGLHAFRPGDSPRHIHWRTTARRGELMVREFEDLPNDNLILLVDPWTPSPAAPGANADLERLLSLAATICWEWCRQKGDEFMLAIAGPAPTLLHGHTGRELALESLRELARVSGTPDTNWSELENRLGVVDFPKATALVLSLRAEVPLEELSGCLRRPATCVNVGEGEERAFFDEAP
jgi:uncharacterized protein (DUF58 family)